MRRMAIRCAGAMAVSLSIAMHCSATTIFSQTITDPSVFDSASGSDRDALSAGMQYADDLTLANAAVVRRATWWGVFGPFENTPVTPVSFDLIFYADSGGLPDTGSILSSTPVQFDTLTDTGNTLGNKPGGSNIYVFQADVTPTTLAAGSKHWFSVLANTANDADDSFLWRMDENGNSAWRNNLAAPFSLSENAVPLFILDGDVIPEPSALMLLGLGALVGVARRHRRRR